MARLREALYAPWKECLEWLLTPTPISPGPRAASSSAALTFRSSINGWIRLDCAHAGKMGTVYPGPIHEYRLELVKATKSLTEFQPFSFDRQWDRPYFARPCHGGDQCLTTGAVTMHESRRVGLTQTPGMAQRPPSTAWSFCRSIGPCGTRQRFLIKPKENAPRPRTAGVSNLFHIRFKNTDFGCTILRSVFLFGSSSFLFSFCTADMAL
ncbi:hypothetical protein EDD36DRAFT_50124 [Exophiala viscosa]|uniref:Uncharacterized protein n=1 Tax=Exophiala viscosa TaxID=2486360 RepID=A0AAN6E6Y6_9EURO|nr:hypothetical protein EDD36DRAFT_50124 [Exophiala viscosa]